MERLPYIIILVIITLLIFISVRLSPPKTIAYGSNKVFHYNILGNYILFQSYLVFILFTVFRLIDEGYGGIDAMAYKLYFIGSEGTWIESLNFQNYEFGYATMIWLVRNFTDDYKVVLFLIYTALFLMLVKYAKYMTRNISTLFSLFLLLALIINSFNTTRVIIAVFIGLMVYILIYKEKYVKAVILSLFALSIHISSVILLPMIAISMMLRKKMSFTRLIIWVLLTTILAFISINVVETIIGNGKYYVYINYKEGIALQTYLIIFIVFLLSVYKYRELIEINSFNKTLITILPLAFVIIPLQLKYSILYRMLLYFLPIVYTLIPSLLKAYSVRNFNSIYYAPIKIGLITYLVLKIYIFINVELASAGLPYVNVLFD
ncbi:EpsG family protein [Mesobacillus subterraneus]|uniref:EpsG family protein n=1 Tax=Mesobacillus subterraneus TaxID=285983 RepID=UPI0014756E8D|nr:EpsG family protein [Mesobacillus subterraneus]